MSTRPRRTRPISTPSPAMPATDAPGDGPAADAALLVARVGDELAAMSLAVEDLQATLGTALAAAAEHDPAVMQQAQALDLVTQWLRGLSLFLSEVRHRRIGREPLDFDALVAPLDLTALGDRLAGRVPAAPADGLDLF